MKRFLKFLSIITFALLTLSLPVLPFFASEDSNELIGGRENYLKAHSIYANVAEEPFFPEADGYAIIFLYTKTAETLTFEFINDGDPRFYNTSYLENNYYRLYNEQVENALNNDPYVPKLLALVKAFHIDKEELYAAKERMNGDKEYMTAFLPEDRPSEADVSYLIGDFGDDLDFVIEAMYLNDDYETMKLLAKPWVMIAEDRPLMLGWLMKDEKWVNAYHLSMDDLKNKDLRREDVAAFIGYCHAWRKNPWQTETFHFTEEDLIALDAHLDELEKIISTNTAPPQAGARTGAYLGAAALCAALLAGGVSAHLHYGVFIAESNYSSDITKTYLSPMMFLSNVTYDINP